MTTSTAPSPIPSVDAARIFLVVGGEMSSKKLQRIIYLAHENHIRETDKPMIQGYPIEASEQGPVFANLYHLIGDSDKGRVTPEDLPDGKVVADEDTREYVASVYKIFEDVSGEYLSRVACWRRSPWSMARRTIRRAGSFEWRRTTPSTEKPVISNSMIRHCFQAM